MLILEDLHKQVNKYFPKYVTKSCMVKRLIKSAR